MISSGHMGGPRGLIRNFGDDSDAGRIEGRVLLRLMKFVIPHWKSLVVAMALMIITTAGGLLIPYLSKIIIDVHIKNVDFQGLLKTSLILGAAMIATYFASSGQRYALARVGQRVLFTLRNRLFEHLQKLSVAYHDSHIVGVTVSRVINDVSVINMLLSEGLVAMIGDTLLIVGTIVVMMVMDARLALITFSIIPLMVLATYLFSRKARVAFRDTREKVATLVGNLAENISGIRVIQSYVQEDASQRRFEENNRKNRNAHVYAMSLSFVFLPAMDFLSVMATCIVLLAGGLMAASGNMTIGIIVAFMTYVNRFFMPIRELSQLFTTLQSATAGGEKVLDILDTPPAVADSPDAEEREIINGKIEFQNVSFSYDRKVEVLHDISLVIEPGETVAIVGPTGAGKTSITNLICRFYECTAGKLLVDDCDVRAISLESLHRHMGYVSQDPFLFAGTIAENIGYGKKGNDREAIIESAKHAEADTFIKNLPDGYDTQILEGGVNLSTGQRQLISISRAVLIRPSILIMDEATSSVDTVTEGLIQKALVYLLKGRTAIVIAHRLTTVQGADRIYVVDDGRITETGTHNQLIAARGMYRNLYERQFIGK